MRRFAYADPPYPGQAKLYRKHPDFAGEVDHAELISRLEMDYPDGWALSTSVPALGEVLQMCPQGSVSKGGVRVCAWVRSTVPRPPARLMYSWEPVIVRSSHWRRRHDRDFVRDSLYAPQPSGFLGGDITGQKPREFCHWLFDLLGMEPADELVDLFPGSGAVSTAWNAWRAQERLAI